MNPQNEQGVKTQKSAWSFLLSTQGPAANDDAEPVTPEPACDALLLRPSA